jgi:ubiquinone/menaquinone biosynthesis C-methylase UbiE
VDLEILHFNSEKFGVILFQKLAAQITDDHGNTLAWSVNLNILVAEKTHDLWQAIRARLEGEVNWSRYAPTYDKLLEPFDDYVALVNLVVGLVGDARRCVDLGAGTGNGTLKLLETNPQREVWAVESNEAMLNYLRNKVRRKDDQQEGGYWDRLTVVKDDILRLGDLPASYFDAAVLINVLYAVEDPRRCLAEAYRLLKPGGILVLSTPHRETNVGRLLAQMRTVLERKGKFEALRSNYETARHVHRKMEDLIHRDTKEAIKEYLKAANFRIEEWRDKEYVDSVVVVKAIKDGL